MIIFERQKDDGKYLTHSQNHPFDEIHCVFNKLAEKIQSISNRHEDFYILLKVVRKNIF